MKQGIFAGTFIAGLGIFFLLKQWSIPFLGEIALLPGLLLIIGIGFLLQVDESLALFSGVVLCGLAVHFYAIEHLTTWPKDWIVYFFIIGLAFLLQYKKHKQQGLWMGATLSILSLFGYFSTGSIKSLNELISYVEQFWALILIGIGAYLFIRKK